MMCCRDDIWGHPLWSITGRSYVPGTVTAPFLLIVAILSADPDACRRGRWWHLPELDILPTAIRPGVSVSKRRLEMGFPKTFAVIALWIASLIIVAAIAQAQTPAQRGTTPTIISGNDLGFRVERQ